MTDQPLKDGQGYMTDMEELMDRRLDAKLKPFIQVVMQGHEQIVQGQKEQNKFLKKTMKHDTSIKAIGLGQILTVIGVLIHWIIGR